ncbi:hypothetical protein ACQEU3_10240 [Spirillospora sp. CA-253888]
MSGKNPSPEQLEIQRLSRQIAVYEDQIDSLWSGVKRRDEQINLLKRTVGYRAERAVLRVGQTLLQRLTGTPEQEPFALRPDRGPKMGAVPSEGEG